MAQEETNMERLPNCKRNEKAFCAVMPLRIFVQHIITETSGCPTKFDVAGEVIRGEVKNFVSENISNLPEVVPVAPNLNFITASVELQRLGQNPNMCQSALNKVWFTHSGLIVNALERRFEE